MNKRHYEHTLPNIRGSLSNTYEATAFFNLINTLHEKTSIIITTNKAPTEWVETLNDEILASALLDRLLYRCEVIKFTGSSYRLENRQTIFKTTGTRNELMKP